MLSKEQIATIRRIQQTGYLTDIPVTERQASAPRESVLRVHSAECCLRDYGYRAAVSLHVHIAARTRALLCGVASLSVNGASLPVDWLMNDERDYVLPDRERFPFSAVLNHRFEEGLLVYRSKPAEGWLLGDILEDASSHWQGNTNLEARLTFFDDFEEEFSVDLRLNVRRVPLPLLRGRTGSLYDGVVVPGPEEVARAAYRASMESGQKPPMFPKVASLEGSAAMQSLREALAKVRAEPRPGKKVGEERL